MNSLRPITQGATTGNEISPEILDAVRASLPTGPTKEETRAALFTLARRIKDHQEAGRAFSKADLSRGVAVWETEAGVSMGLGVALGMLLNGLEKAETAYSAPCLIRAYQELLTAPLSPAAQRFEGYPGQQRVWLAVEAAHRCADQDGTFFLSQTRAAELTGVSQRTVSKYLQAFEALDLIEKTAEHSFLKVARQDRKASSYRLTALAQVVRSVVTMAQSAVGKVWRALGTLKRLVTGTPTGESIAAPAEATERPWWAGDPTD